MPARFTAHILDAHTWADLEALFGRPGGSIVRGCWCMYYRKSGAGSTNTSASVGNRERLRVLVDQGTTPGLVGYLDATPVGWISLGPRAEYLRLRRSPLMKPVDAAEVLSIVCSYVDKAHRGLRVQHKLLSAAIDYARANGVRLLEAYPVDKPERSIDDFMFFGSRSLYERAGFHEVVRRSPTRIVMRRALRPPRGAEPSTQHGADNRASD